MAYEMKVGRLVGNVRNESNLYPMEDVNSNTLARANFSVSASSYNDLSIALTKAPDRTRVNFSSDTTKIFLLGGMKLGFRAIKAVTPEIAFIPRVSPQPVPPY
jgi:hypothetical protein